MEFINELKELRNRMPIGIKKAVSLLKIHNGNIDLSMEQFKKELINDLMLKTGTDSNTAIHVLDKADFNIHEAINLIYENKYSKTENILKRITTSEQKSMHLYRAIINEKYDFGTYNTDKEHFNRFNTPQRSLLILIEWLEYLDYEGFYSALQSEFFEKAVLILDSKLNMPHLSSELKRAKAIEVETRKGFNLKSNDIHNYLAFIDELNNNDVFSSIEKLLWEEKEENVYIDLILYVEKTSTPFLEKVKNMLCLFLNPFKSFLYL